MSTSSRSREQNTALPAFTSIRRPSRQDESHDSSSKASSSRSGVTFHHHESPKVLDMNKSSIDVQNITRARHTILETPPHVESSRRIKRSSGGFLLDASPSSSRISSLIRRKPSKEKENSQEKSFIVKGKRPEKRDTAEWQKSSPSSSARSGRYSGLDGQNEVDSAPTSTQNPTRTVGTSSLRSQEESTAPSQTGGYGFDTDPIQIVDMALRLHDARCRQISGRRNISAVSHNPYDVPSSRPVSQSIKESDKISTVPVTPDRAHISVSKPQIVVQSYGSPDQVEDELDDVMHISRATQNRVAKAKEYFELAYEHRRLLSHLPPLRQPHLSSPTSSNIPDTKLYNPLQYARNRKLRFREKAAISSEAEGWHDVLKVRAWVDAVVTGQWSAHHGPLECVRLPPLDLHEKPQDEEYHSTKSPQRRRNTLDKPRRPKSDWITYPGDLIADAFWTEQGLNKLKIYNRDNEPIYPPGTEFTFSGWRNRTPADIPDDLRSPPSSPEDTQSFGQSRQVSAAPDLPTFESAHRAHGWAKTCSKFTNALKKGPHNKARRDGDIFDTSSDSNSSDGSLDTSASLKLNRGRKRHQKHKDGPDTHNMEPLSVQSEAVPRIGNLFGRSTGVSSERMTDAHERSQSHDLSNLSESERYRSGKQQVAIKEHKGSIDKKRNLFDNFRIDHDDKARSSFEYDTTAPPTPADVGFPSIAINLSPPHSRSPSPGHKKPSIIGIVKDRVQNKKDRVDRTDFAQSHVSLHHPKRDSTTHSKRESLSDSRGTSPMTRGTSPFTKGHNNFKTDESNLAFTEPRSNTISKVSTRTNDSDRHRSLRVRGMFKGGRIAELVGNEVSRVGDYIWKRDIPHDAGLDSGSASGYESDSDELPEDRSNTIQPQSLKVPTDTSPEIATKQRAQNDQPQYHIQGLPSFTSPFQRDRDSAANRVEPQSPGGTLTLSEDRSDDGDPVSSAVVARRAGKSPRLDQMALPKLNIGAATPKKRRNSYGFGSALNLAGTRSASDKFNEAINGTAIASGASGQNPLEKGKDSSRRPSMMEIYKTRSQGQARPDKMVSVQELMRTRGLLIATVIKAGSISAYCEQYPQPQSAFLYKAFTTTGTFGTEVDRQIPVKRKDEHSLAARHLINHLQKRSEDFNSQLKYFAEQRAQELQREVQILQDSADHSLFPRLQDLSERAGQLAQKLTTTSTLAVKSVNDEVIEATKLKRRGPFRFSRALGYKLIEWAVVSILWIIWFDVTIIRLVLGIIKAIWSLIAWLFFLR